MSTYEKGFSHLNTVDIERDNEDPIYLGIPMFITRKRIICYIISATRQ